MRGREKECERGRKSETPVIVEEAKGHWGVGHSMAQVSMTVEDGPVVSLDRYLR